MTHRAVTRPSSWPFGLFLTRTSRNTDVGFAQLNALIRRHPNPCHLASPAAGVNAPLHAVPCGTM